MGSASRSALAEVRSVLEGFKVEAASGLGRELLNASATLARNPGLLAALSDAAASSESKAQLIDRVFANSGSTTRKVLTAVAAERWSNSNELVDGVEELGIRAEALAQTGIGQELLAIEQVISGSHELELTLGNKLGSTQAKVQAVRTLFEGKVSAAAVEIASHVVAEPRGRRVRRVLREFANLVADQDGADLATVTLATPIDDARLARLQELLSRTAGRSVKITTVIDPTIVGGMHIQIGDTVIDGSVKARLDDLRLQRAG